MRGWARAALSMAVACLLCGAAAPAGYPDPLPVRGDTIVHDPSLARAPDGTYVLAHTGDGLPLKTSRDRTTWHDAGVVWPDGAPWTAAYTGGGPTLWAPDISRHHGRFYLYYAASSFGSQHSAIFLATSPTGAAGTWTNDGLVISSSPAVDYNAIDPNLSVDARGRWWLAFGSFWTGIKQIRLNPATGRPYRPDPPVRALADRSATPPGAIEAPFVVRHGGAYYLFVSFDFCCRGAASTYRIMVGRSRAIGGPYAARDGTPMTSGGGTEIMAGHGSVHGPGGQSVLGNILVYHYYADDGTPYLGIDRLGWDRAGWPYVY